MNRIYSLVQDNLNKRKKKKERKLNSKKEKLLQSKIQRTVKNTTECIEKLELNKAVSELMQLTNELQKFEEKNSEVFWSGIEKLVLMLNPFAPHLSEELWEKIGKKNFSSLEKWPEFEEKKIDLVVEKEEEFLNSVKRDVEQIKELLKKEKIEKVKVFVCPKWKWKLFKKLFEEKEKQENKRIEFGQAMKKAVESEKTHKKELKGFVQTAVKKLNEMQNFVEIKEIEVLKENLKELKKELEAEVELVQAEKSKEQKAGNAFPLKPAILIE